MSHMNTNMANDVLAAIATMFDGGTLTFRTAPVPASAEAAKTGTVLAVVPIAADSLSVPANRQMTGNGLPWEDTAADATGVAAWATFENVGATRRWDVSVSVTGGAGELQVEDVNFTAGEGIKVTALTINYPL
jgi:hypothetical protein